MSPVYHQEGRGDHADAAVLWLPGQLEQHWSVVLVLALSLQSGYNRDMEQVPQHPASWIYQGDEIKTVHDAIDIYFILENIKT